MEETIATRLKLFIDTKGITTSQFADMCGIPRPSLSQILTGRNKKVSDIIVGQIHKTFPDLSIMWLLFGEGPVSVSAASANSVVEKTALSGAEKFVKPGNISAKSEYSKENGLREAENGFKSTNNQSFEAEIKINDLHRQIENLRKNPRRVVQITIYYDDSTFETFVPKG